MNKQLVPPILSGPSSNIAGDMSWLNQLPANTYYFLWGSSDRNFNLPLGHDCYVISYHSATLDIDWLKIQTKRILAPIILLSDFNYYNFLNVKNLHCYTYHSWHKQIELLRSQSLNKQPKNIKYKASAVCGRITQSKLISLTAVAEILGQKESLLILGNSLEEKDVHHRVKTNNVLVDQISDVFWNKYYGQIFKMDSSQNSTDQWNPLYQECALHFTNERFSYSYIQTSTSQYTCPGPFLTEKTFKCLIGGTGFVPVGQFDVYRSLSLLGFKFDYDLDLGFDTDSGNITRLEKTIKLIQNLESLSAQEIYELTKHSSLYNQELIESGDLYTRCEQQNSKTAQLILGKFGY